MEHMEHKQFLFCNNIEKKNVSKKYCKYSKSGSFSIIIINLLNNKN